MCRKGSAAVVISKRQDNSIEGVVLSLRSVSMIK